MAQIFRRELDAAIKSGIAKYVGNASDTIPVGKAGSDALPDGLYGPSYFGVGRNPSSRDGVSGYATYDRVSSNANIQAYVIWRTFDVKKVLDVGCALGYSVEAFREIGVDAWGVDYSNYAVAHCTPPAAGYIYQADLLSGTFFEDAAFDMVMAFEVLEHLPPDDVSKAISELRRITSSYLVATIPSVGPNEFGPSGWFEGKIRPERLEYYNSLPPDYQGPVPYEDLIRDKNGNPMEGHLIVASFSWWQERFQECGFMRCGELERRLHVQIERFGLAGSWCCYVLAVDSEPRGTKEIDEMEHRLKLDKMLSTKQ